MPTTDDTPTAAGATNVLLNQRALTAPYHREAVGIQGDENIGKAIGFDASGTLGAIEVGGGGGTYVGTIAEMRALTDLSPGQVIYVGPLLDQFLVVDDDSLGTDGGTVFIPDSELSEVHEEAIPPGFFTDAYGPDVAREYDLDYTGIDFESVELVLTNAGETVDIWLLHGHCMSPNDVERVNTPQLPLIDVGRGKFRDPFGVMTGDRGPGYPAIRTGGALLRYKYATSGLRLKRIAGPVFDLRWWPVIAVDDEAPGVQTDNSGRICWCANAAAVAKAEAVLVTKMYHYQRCVEWPEYVEMRGLGPGISGFRVMDNGQFKEMLFSASIAGAAHDQTQNPTLTPSTRLWSYDGFTYAQATTFFPATGARRVRISGIEFDGNIENNMRLFTERENEYAWKYANSSIHLFNTPASIGYASTNHGARVIPEGAVLELHNVKVHGYGQGILGNHNLTTVGTGVIEVGNCIAGHYFYLVDGVYERIKCFGYCQGDGLRCRHLIVKSLEFVLQPLPEVMFFLATLPADERSYAMRTMFLITSNEYPQAADPTHGAPYPQLTKQRILVEHMFVDGTGLDNWPPAYSYQTMQLFFIGADDIHIKAGKIRYGRKYPSISHLINSNVAIANYGGIFKNQEFENLHIEIGSRKGFELHTPGYPDGGISQATFRNITVEPRAVTRNINDPYPDGVCVPLGTWRFNEIPMVEPSGSPLYYHGPYDGKNFEFSAITPDATLNGKYIDITPPDDGAPTFRLWFNYNAVGTAPSATGVTLIEVPVPAAPTPTPAIVCAAFSAAIAGSLTVATAASPYLTAATFGTKSVVGSFSNYRGGPKWGYVTANITSATGVTTSPRADRRNYEPAFINFERYNDPESTGIYLLDIFEISPSREVFFKFDQCSFGMNHFTCIGVGTTKVFSVAGTNPADVAKDRIHCAWTNSMFDLRDYQFSVPNASSLDLFLYTSTFRNCRVRTARVSTGISSLGASYEILLSEDSGIYTVTPTAGVTFVEIQTKLFWLPKDGQTRFYPADAATAVVWNTNMPSPEWRRSARPVTGASVIALGGTGAYYQGPDGINEDRRAPVLRLNFATPLAATQLKIGWAAAVSP